MYYLLDGIAKIDVTEIEPSAELPDSNFNL